jgi:hypothetical protein
LEPAGLILESCVREGIDEYRRKSKSPFPGTPSLVLYSTLTGFTASRPGNPGDPIVLEEKGDELVLHLCRELLRPAPERAIKGWLYHVLGHYQLSKQRAFSPFNFSRQILPLFPVTGSAVNLVRQIVERLKNGLEAFLTIRWIAAIGLGEEQVSLFSYRLKILAEEMETYHLAIPHPWIRAACLSGFLQHFLAITCLDRQDLSAARDLKIQWWSRHGLLLREDQALLEEMALVPLEKGSRPFPALLAELFQLLRSNLLSGPIKNNSTETWH